MQKTSQANSTTARLIAAAFLCVFAATTVAACAPARHGEMNDPIEPVNRAIFGFNNVIDVVLIEPAAKAYNFILPGFVRDSVQNFMRNLRSPLIIANNLLQGDLGDAGVATARFVINSTVGVAGLIDVAATQGFEYEQEDLGQTLAVWGFGDGMYLVLPIIGPSSVRDTAGMLGDAFADPVRIVAFNTDNEWIYYTRNAVEGLDNRSRMIRTVNDLKKNNLDYYAAVRSAYAQRRSALIHDERPGSAEAVVVDFDEEY